MNDPVKSQEPNKAAGAGTAAGHSGHPAAVAARIAGTAAETTPKTPGTAAPAGSWADGDGFADKRHREYDYEKMRLPRSKSFWMPLAYAALAGFAFMTLRYWLASRQLEESAGLVEAKNGAIASLESEINSLRATSEQEAGLVRLLNRPGSSLVTLSSLAPAPTASGKVLWDRGEGRGFLWVSNLPADAAGKDYQLWAIAGGAPVSAGVFSVENGQALIPLTSLPGEGVASFVITLEPEGGVPAPGGDRVLLGNVGE